MADLNINVSTLKEVADQLQDVDTKLAASGGEKASVRKILDDARTAGAEKATKGVDSILSQVEKMPPEVMVAFSDQLKAALREKVEPLINKFVETKKAEMASVSPDENVEQLKTQRKELIEQYKILKKILVTFKQDISGIYEPKTAGRPKGTGTTRKNRGVNYYVDDKKQSDSGNNLSQVAFLVTKHLSKEERGGKGPAKVLKEFLETQGISKDKGNLYGDWEVKFTIGEGPKEKTFKIRSEKVSTESTEESAA